MGRSKLCTRTGSVASGSFFKDKKKRFRDFFLQKFQVEILTKK